MKGKDFYNEDYFTPGMSGAYVLPFTWENEMPHAMKQAAKVKQLYNPETVLDIGSAKGFFIKAISKMGVDASGCDISQWAIDHCEMEAEGKLKQCDIREGLPYPDGSFDVVYSFHTFEHIEMEYLDNLASEIYRVTKGWVHIGMPAGLTNRNIPLGDHSHVTYMPTSYWVSLFYKHGFLMNMPACSHSFFLDENKYPICANIELSLYKVRI